MPIASATAATPRTRGGNDLEENSGAIMNSGAIRASTSANARTCCSEKRSSSGLGVHPPATSSGIEP